jgi:hypothetical protein
MMYEGLTSICFPTKSVMSKNANWPSIWVQRVRSQRLFQCCAEIKMSLADVQVEAPKNCLKVMKQMCPKIGAHADPVITRNHSKGNQRLGRKPDALER